MSSQLRSFPLALGLALASLAGCQSDDDVGSQQQAGQAVCLKVCLDAAGVFCESYCPPANGCLLTCDPHAMVVGTEDQSNAPGQGATGDTRPGAICQWSCPGPNCEPVCEPGCPGSGTQSGEKAGDCCRLPPSCAPPPQPAPCSSKCDLQCLEMMKNLDQTAGFDPQELFARCCPSSCPPSTCTTECDPQCTANSQSADANGQKDFAEHCCREVCTGTGQNPPAPPACTPECLNSFAQQGDDAARQICCPAPQPSNGCQTQCDWTCLEGLLAQGFSKDQAVQKCCPGDCAPLSPSPSGETCRWDCIKLLLAQNFSEEEAKKICCNL